MLRVQSVAEYDPYRNKCWTDYPPPHSQGQPIMTSSSSSSKKLWSSSETMDKQEGAMCPWPCMTSRLYPNNMLVTNDNLCVIVHNLFQMLCTNPEEMLCTNPEAYVGWRPFWIFWKIGNLPWRNLWGFSTALRVFSTPDDLLSCNDIVYFPRHYFWGYN